MALSRIRGLRVFGLHTSWCEGECGFDKDGIFDQSKVQATRIPAVYLRFTECAMSVECFKREFVEGLRAKMIRKVTAVVGEVVGSTSHCQDGEEGGEVNRAVGRGGRRSM